MGVRTSRNEVAERYLAASGTADSIRAEIESRIVKRERFATSVEVPLSQPAKRVLHQAGEEADRLGHRHIGTEHLLLALLEVNEGLAAKVLAKSRAGVGETRVMLANAATREQRTADGRPWVPIMAGPPKPPPTLFLNTFLGQLRAGLATHYDEFFAPESSYIDATGSGWFGTGALGKKMKELFAPFAAPSATYVQEKLLRPQDDLCVAIFLWRGIPLPSTRENNSLRMTIVLAPSLSKSSDWCVYGIQVTPVA